MLTELEKSSCERNLNELREIKHQLKSTLNKKVKELEELDKKHIDEDSEVTREEEILDEETELLYCTLDSIGESIESLKELLYFRENEKEAN